MSMRHDDEVHSAACGLRHVSHSSLDAVQVSGLVLSPEHAAVHDDVQRVSPAIKKADQEEIAESDPVHAYSNSRFPRSRLPGPLVPIRAHIRPLNVEAQN